MTSLGFLVAVSLEFEKQNIEMGLISHRLKQSEIKAGDHLYTWRAIYTYSHHGIYVGGDKIVHFTQNQLSSSSVNSSLFSSSFNSSPLSGPSVNSSSSSCPSVNSSSSSCPSVNSSSSSCPSVNSSSSSSSSVNSRAFLSSSSVESLTCLNFADCGFEKDGSGVVMSCLNCFLGNGSLYRYEYGVGAIAFAVKIRGGTCTKAKSDPPDVVVNRAMCLLHKGFGNYDLFKNNCEDFALYCKSGLLVVRCGESVGGSGQASSLKSATMNVITSLPLALISYAPFVISTAPLHLVCCIR